MPTKFWLARPAVERGPDCLELYIGPEPPRLNDDTWAAGEHGYFIGEKSSNSREIVFVPIGRRMPQLGECVEAAVKCGVRSTKFWVARPPVNRVPKRVLLYVGPKPPYLEGGVWAAGEQGYFLGDTNWVFLRIEIAPCSLPLEVGKCVAAERVECMGGKRSTRRIK